MGVIFGSPTEIELGEVIGSPTEFEPGVLIGCQTEFELGVSIGSPTEFELGENIQYIHIHIFLRRRQVEGPRHTLQTMLGNTVILLATSPSGQESGMELYRDL